MYMRIIWGRIASGQWDAFEAAYKKATALRGDVNQKPMAGARSGRSGRGLFHHAMGWRSGHARILGQQEARRGDGPPAPVLPQSVHCYSM